MTVTDGCQKLCSSRIELRRQDNTTQLAPQSRVRNVKAQVNGDGSSLPSGTVFEFRRCPVVSVPIQEIQFASVLPQLQNKFALSYNARDIDAIVEFYMPDAFLLLPDKKLVLGRAAIREHHAAQMAAGCRFVRFDTVALATEDSRAIEVADVTTEWPGERSGFVLRKERVVAIWNRRPDGGWKLGADIFV